MIHKFLNSEIVKVDDISYISVLTKNSGWPYITYKYSIHLNNNVEIIQELRIRIKKIYQYDSDLKDVEEIECYLKPNTYIDDTVKVEVTEKHRILYTETTTYKSFIDNYNKLVEKFSKINE